MKNFKEFLNEEIMPYAQTEKGFVGVDNGPVRDNINIHLAAVTAKPHATPYHAMEMIRKVLAPFSIFPPQTNFLDGDSGHEVIQIKQFGDKMGMTNDGEVVVKNFSPYYVYFEYQMNDTGSFDIFCEIVTEDELEEIMSDIEDEMEEGETTDGDEADAEDSFDDYKAGNDLKEDYPGVQRRSNKTLDPDLQKDFKDYKSDQQAKHSSNMVKMSYQNSPNRTFKTMGQTMPWKSTDSRAKYDATRDKIVDKQNQREIRRYVPVTVKEETLEEKTTASKKAKKGTKWKLISRNPDSEGSEMELRQGKRKKMTGYYDRNASMFTMSKTKKGKFDPKSKQKDYDDAEDILKTVKEEQLNELRGKGSVDKEKLKKHILKKHDAAWEKTIEKRKKNKSSGPADTRDEDKHRNRLGKMYNKLEEDYEKDAAELSKKYAAYAKHEKAMSKSNSLAAQLSPYYRKEMAKRSKDSKAISKRLYKKAVTGMEEETINEISAGKANDAYHAAADKGKTADVMAGATGSKKWRKRANKKWDQARKFADYADKKLQLLIDKKLKEETELDRWKRKYDERKKEMGHDYVNVMDKPPFDNPTEKPSTPYKNPKAKAKQLARMAMKKAKTEKK